MRRRRYGTLAALAASSACLAFSYFGQGCKDSPASAGAPDPIVIGVSLGLSGGLQALGADLRNAIEVAQGQINAQGGLLGRQVEFAIEDDRSDEESYVQEVAHRLVERGAVAVIGPLGSQQVVRTAKIFADAQVVQITPTATSVDLTSLQANGDRWLFRTTPADDLQSAAVILLAQRTPKGLGDASAPVGEAGVPATCNKLAILNVDNSYGNSMADIITRSIGKSSADRQVVIQRKVAVKIRPDYVDEATAIVQSAIKPECLALIAYDDVAAQFVRDLKSNPAYRSLPPDFFIIGTDGVFTNGFLKNGRDDQADETSANVAEGVFGTNPDTQNGSKEYNDYRTIYSSYFPSKTAVDAPPFTSNAFDAAMMIALAITQAGSVDDHRRIRDALIDVANPPGRSFTAPQLGDALQAVRQGQNVDFKGASGAVDLEPNGNVKAGFIVWEAFRDPTTKKLGYRTLDHFTAEQLAGQIQ